MSRATAELRLAFASEHEAEAVAAALAGDDDAFSRTRREGNLVVVACEADDVPGLRRAVDDVLANLGVSEDLLDTDP